MIFQSTSSWFMAYEFTTQVVPIVGSLWLRTARHHYHLCCHHQETLANSVLRALEQQH